MAHARVARQVVAAVAFRGVRRVAVAVSAVVAVAVAHRGPGRLVGRRLQAATLAPPRIAAGLVARNASVAGRMTIAVGEVVAATKATTAMDGR